MKERQENTADLIRAVRSEARQMKENGRRMSMIVAVAWASGYAGHKAIDLWIFYDALESMYIEGLLTSI